MLNLKQRFEILFFFLVLSSCGIETISTLSPPTVDYLNQASSTVISFSNTLAGTSDFMGYEIFYKIYPSISTTAHLIADNDYLTNYGATKDMLYQLGYKRFNLSLTQRTVEPLIDLASNNVNSSSTVITLDFTDFIAKQAIIITSYSNTSEIQPRLTISGLAPLAFFRGVLNTDNTYKKFNSLYSTFSGDGDFDSTVTSSTPTYEICLFVASYAWSPDATTYSRPVPLGIIRDIVR